MLLLKHQIKIVKEVQQEVVVEDQDDDSGIRNPYLDLDDEFKEETKPNPYVKLRHFLLPANVLVVAPSGSGKTAYLYQCIEKFQDGEQGKTFDDGYIITKDSDEPLYNAIKKKRPEFQVLEGIDSLPDLAKMDKDKNHLIVFDDMVNEKTNANVLDYLTRARKMCCSIFFLTQSYYKTEKFIRDNMFYNVVLNLPTKRDIDMCLSQVSLSLNSETMVSMYKYATRNKGVPLVINLREYDENKRFRKGFSAVTLKPADFAKTSNKNITVAVANMRKALEQPQDKYYTPDGVVDIILQDCVRIIGEKPKGIILDPCKGAGAFINWFLAIQ